MDVGGHSTSSGQQIWTMMDVPGHPGNTPKLSGDWVWTCPDVLQHPPTSRFSTIFGRRILARLVIGIQVMLSNFWLPFRWSPATIER